MPCPACTQETTERTVPLPTDHPARPIRRRNASATPAANAAPAGAATGSPTASLTGSPTATPRPGQTVHTTPKRILDRFAPATVLVNASAEALYFCGPTDEFLTRPRGIPTHNLLDLLRDGLRARVRGALQQAARGEHPVEVQGARMRSGAGYCPVHFTVTRSTEVDGSPVFLVVFQHASPPPPETDAPGADSALLSQLEDELQSTRDNLEQQIEDAAAARQTVQQLKTRLQQLQSTGNHQQTLREHTGQLRALASALALAEERERRSLAQDLHDDLGQMVALIKLKAAAMAAFKLPPAQQHALKECLAAVDETHRKLRAMTFRLSPPMLHDMGLVPALDWLADEIRQVYKLQVALHDDGQPKPLEPSVSTTLFRAVRELLINVAKHAQVHNASVHVNIETVNGGEQLNISVSDAGTGFNPDAVAPHNGHSGFGLLSVRERISYLGGTMQIISHPGDGTTVLLSMPMLRDDPSKGIQSAGTAPTEVQA